MGKIRAAGDRLVPAMLAGGGILAAAGIAWSFTMAPLVDGAPAVPEMVGGQMVSHELLLSQKIFYIHVPVAMAAFAALAFAAVYSARYLLRRDLRDDVRARVSVEVAGLFAFCVMATGVPWTRFEWGVWWTWDARLSTFLVLCLMIAAYFALRAAFGEDDRCPAFAAAFALLMCADVPVCLLVTRLVPAGLHPVVLRSGSGLSPDMLAGLLMTLAGVLLVAYGLYRLRVRQQFMARRLRALRERVEELT